MRVRLTKREIYSSPNGDRWFLVRDPNGRVAILHEPNPASGGQVSDIDVGTFLIRGGRAPEHQELLRLIGTLVDQPTPSETSERQGSAASRT
jgi:hypothetical protein